MIVRLGMSIRVDTERLAPEMRAEAIAECELQGFPVDEENIAWFAADIAAKEGEDWANGIRIEMEP